MRTLVVLTLDEEDKEDEEDEDADATPSKDDQRNSSIELDWYG